MVLLVMCAGLPVLATPGEMIQLDCTSALARAAAFVLWRALMSPDAITGVPGQIAATFLSDSCSSAPSHSRLLFRSAMYITAAENKKHP
jgi:hypothetical protein